MASAAGSDVAPDVMDADAQQQQQHDVWAELFGLVQGLGENVGLALQALTPSPDDKVGYLCICKRYLARKSRVIVPGRTFDSRAHGTMLQAVSAITKKRLAIRSVQGLKQSQVGIQVGEQH